MELGKKWGIPGAGIVPTKKKKMPQAEAMGIYRDLQWTYPLVSTFMSESIPGVLEEWWEGWLFQMKAQALNIGLGNVAVTPALRCRHEREVHRCEKGQRIGCTTVHTLAYWQTSFRQIRIYSNEEKASQQTTKKLPTSSLFFKLYNIGKSNIIFNMLTGRYLNVSQGY